MKINFRNLKLGALAALIAASCLLTASISAQNKAEYKTKDRDFVRTTTIPLTSTFHFRRFVR